MRDVDAVSKTLLRVQKASFLAGLAAALPCVVTAIFWPGLFFPAYLVAFLFYWMIALGCFAIALLHRLTGGGWGWPIRRPLEAGCDTLPLLAVLFLPILLNLPSLYLWARPESVASDVVLQQKAAYLNVPFFQLRAGFYFLVWIFGAFLLNGFARRSSSNVIPGRPWTWVAGPGLVLWGLTTTFAAIDWSMSLEPHWISSVYGVLFMAGQAVSGLAFVICVAILLSRHPHQAPQLSVSRLHDLGNFLMAFTLFWTYISFTQYLVIWSGNLPEETPWYLNRGAGGWQYLGIAIIGLHFVLPFLLLLCRSTKRSSERLFLVALLLLVMRLADLYWLILPAFWPGRFVFNMLLPLTMLSVGGIWCSVYVRNLSYRISLPLEEPPVESDGQHDHIERAVS